MRIPFISQGLELLNNDKELINLYGDHPQEIRLPYDQNFFTIHFRHLNWYLRTKSISLALWRILRKTGRKYPIIAKFSCYTNVPPGEHLVFYVKSSDSNGKWNEKASCLKNTHHSPWWHCGWAFSVYESLDWGYWYSHYGFTSMN